MRQITITMTKSTFSSKVLELVAKEVGEYFTGNEIVKILTEFGLNREIIQYPNTKWWTINEAFKYIKSNDKDPETSISKLIMNFLHPLNHNLDYERVEKLANKVGKYLKYDNFYVEDIGSEYLVISNEEMEEMHSIPEDVLEEDRKNGPIYEEGVRKNREVIHKLRENHQAFMDIVEIFFQNPTKPTKELNDAYLFLSNKIQTVTEELNLGYFGVFFYKPFRNDLYGAEMEWKNLLEDNPLMSRLSWNTIRPRLYQVHSSIIKVQNMADSEMEMTDDDKKLEEISNLISQKRAPKPTVIPTLQPNPITQRIEIVKMPDLKIKEDKGNKKPSKKISLKGKDIKFDEAKPAIIIDHKSYPLPPAKNEDFLCRVMFSRPIGEFVDWSIIYREITGIGKEKQDDNEIGNDKNKKTTRDTMDRLNKRFQEILNTEDQILSWENKSIKRNF